MIETKTTPQLSAQRNGGPQFPAEGVRALTIREIVRVIASRRLTVLTVFLSAFGLCLLYLALATRRYEGVARVDIDPNRASASTLSDSLAQGLGEMQTSTRIETEMKVMQSDTVLLKVARRLDLAHKAPFTGLSSFRHSPPRPGALELTLDQTDQLLRELADHLRIGVSSGTTLVEVRYESPDPALASAVPNAIVECYIEQDLSASSDGEARVAAWLTSEMDRLRTEAARAQMKLAEFQRENHVVGMDESQNVLIDKLRLLNQHLTEAEADRIVKESLVRVAESHDPKLLATLSQGATLQLLRTQQVNVQSQRDQVASKFGAGYSKLLELDYQLQRLNTDIDKEADNIYRRFNEEYLSSKRAEDQLRSEFDREEQAFYQLNKGVAQFAILRHEAVSTRDLYDALQYKLKEAGITEVLKSTMIRIVDNARQTTRPVSPKAPLVIACGLLLGMVGSIGVALTTDSLDDTVRSSRDVEEVLCSPILATIPHIEDKAPGKGQGTRSTLPALEDRNSAAAEGYRQLRSGLLLSNAEGPPRLIVFASSQGGEGRSMAAANCAVSLALQGVTVLLIDADLRRGVLHARFGILEHPGLAAALSGGLAIDSLVRPIRELPGFAVLGAGVRASDPSEILGSKRMSDFLEECLRRFDYVILDSAPLLPLADSYVLAARADALVLVVRAGASRKMAIARTAELLARLNARLVGVVLNDLDLRMERYHTYGGAKLGYGDYREQ